MTPVLPNAIEALVSLGELEQADELATELDGLAERLPRAWIKAMATRSRALVTASQGEPHAALDLIELSLREHDRLGDPFERARTKLVEGAILRRIKKKGAAKTALDEALTAFEQLGARLWRERAAAEIKRIGLRPAASKDLTPTEERVAELVAAGRTNKEVADTLFLSVKTVEANLSRIYSKLRVRSRTELAAAYAAREAANHQT